MCITIFKDNMMFKIIYKIEKKSVRNMYNILVKGVNNYSNCKLNT